MFSSRTLLRVTRSEAERAFSRELVFTVISGFSNNVISRKLLIFSIGLMEQVLFFFLPYNQYPWWFERPNRVREKKKVFEKLSGKDLHGREVEVAYPGGSPTAARTLSKASEGKSPRPTHQDCVHVCVGEVCVLWITPPCCRKLQVWTGCVQMCSSDCLWYLFLWWWKYDKWSSMCSRLPFVLLQRVYVSEYARVILYV